jgi:inhibitor of cysteine peptidase
VDFVGAGDQVATPAEQRMIAEWARLVALEAQGGRSGASWGLVFAWHREGGIAGFCDDVTVYVSGDAYITSCKGDQPQALGRVRLSSNQLTLIYGWMDTLQPLEVEQRDPATADAMTTRIVFSGAGNAAANESIQREISDLALTLIYQATSDAAPVVQPEPLPMPAASAIITTATLPITDTGEAIIERVEVRIVATDPVQIEAVIRGQLPDSCSFIQDASVGVEGNIFTVRLTTARQLDQRCIQILTPFEQIVRLGSPEPAAGAYEVYVGQVVESFTLGE